MKIAYICQTYPPVVTGVSMCMYYLAEGMSRKGHSVLVIVASPSGKYSLDKKEGLTVVGIPSLKNLTAVNQRFMLWQGMMMAKELDSFSPELIHIHDPLFAGIWGVRYANKHQIPLVLTVHSRPEIISMNFPAILSLRKFVEFSVKAYGSWLIEKCEAIVTPSKNMYELVLRKRSLGVHQISNGIDTNLFTPVKNEEHEEQNWRERLGIKDNAPIILQVSRLTKEKRIELVIRASAEVLEKTNAHLVIVGDGPSKKSLLEFCRNLGIEKRSHFPGFISHKQGLPAVYRLASVFFLASEVESQPLIMLEAAASGLPIVALDGPATRELVVDGINGLLVAPAEESMLGNKLRKLVTNRTLMEKYGTASRKVALKHSREDSLLAHQDLYSSLTDTLQ